MSTQRNTVNVAGHCQPFLYTDSAMSQQQVQALKKRWIKRLRRLTYNELVEKAACFMTVLRIEAPPKNIAQNIKGTVANDPATAALQNSEMSMGEDVYVS